MRKRTLCDAVTVGAVVALGIAGLTVGAGEASAAKLPNGSKTATGVDGQVVKITRKGERTRVMRSVANNGMGRAASISGTYRTTLSKGSGTMTVGYLVGCQVSIGGMQLGMSGTIGMTSSLSGSFSIPLQPGQVAFVAADGMSIKDGGKATMMVDSFHLDVQQCGGAASARSVVQVMAADRLSTADGELSGDSGFVQSTLYGKPFSLG